MSTTTPDSADNSSAPLNGASPTETRAFMTKLAGRGYAQFRNILVQLPEEDKPRASTLSRIVTERRHRELLLYMLLVTCWPWLSKQDQPLPAGAWTRSLTAPGALTWSPSTLSRAWKHLEELGLIEERKREDRLVRVTPRREDAQEAYTAPGGRADRWNTYFTIPDVFWHDEWFAKLSMPALAVFLVVAKETSYRDECWFTYNRMDAWYGLKPRTVQAGVKELRDLGLLGTREETVSAPLSATGKTTQVYYALTGEFGRTSRVAMQKKAQAELKTREKRAGKKSKVKMTSSAEQSKKK